MTIAAITLSFSLGGCSSSGSGGDDAGAKVCAQSDVDVIFARSCTTCHDSSGSYAGLNLTSTGLSSRLLGVMPPCGGTVLPSVCTGMSKVYLQAGSNPAAGLLIDKLGSNPGCGARMPYLLPALPASDIACIQSWALTLTSP